MYKYINVENVFTKKIEKFILKMNNDGSSTTFPAVNDNIHYKELMLQVDKGEVVIEEADTVMDNGGNS